MPQTTKPQVVKWKIKGTTRDGQPIIIPALLETIEKHRVRLDDGSDKPINVKCRRPFRGTEAYEPQRPPPDVVMRLTGQSAVEASAEPTG